MSPRRNNNNRSRRTHTRRGRNNQRRARGLRYPRNRGFGDWTVSEVKEGLANMWNAASSAISIFNTEIKMFDLNFNPQLASQAGSIFSLSLMSVGDNYNQRDGLSIRPLQFEVNFSQVWDTTTVASQNGMFRLIIFRDFNCLGASPAVGDLLDTTTVDGLYNHLASDRFQILFDETTSGNTTRDRLPMRRSFAVKDHILYRDATTNPTALGNGSLFLCLITNLAANFPAVYGNTRLYYVDN